MLSPAAPLLLIPGLVLAACGPTTGHPSSGADHPTTATVPLVNTLPSEESIVPYTEADDVVGRLHGLADRAWRVLTIFTKEFSPRASATDEERIAATFLEDQFTELGLITNIQVFTVDILNVDAAHLYFSNPEDMEIPATPMFLSGTGVFSGLIVDVEKAVRVDVSSVDLYGNIALIERGEISFEEKVTRVSEAGAVAAVVYNNVPGNFNGRLMDRGDIPVVSISQRSGLTIKERMERQEIEATVSVVIEEHESRNVIAEQPGTDPNAGVVVIGGHYDTVPDTQGANDNGSGVATYLTVAHVLSERSYPFTVRYIAFGAEEIGLFGSRHYVSSLSATELGQIIAMLNFDVPGSGEFVEVMGSLGLVDTALDYARANDLGVRRGLPLEGATSDHASFSEAGIPVVFILADDLSRINQPGDDIQFVDQMLMGTAALLGIAIVDSLHSFQP